MEGKIPMVAQDRVVPLHTSRDTNGAGDGKVLNVPPTPICVRKTTDQVG